MAKPALKAHFFRDCPNTKWYAREEAVIATDVTLTTCGQCKGRILNAIRDRDWSELESMEVAVLKVAAERLKR